MTTPATATVVTYTLDQINEGYQDMRDGRNIRGVIRYQDGVGHDGR